MNAEAKFVASVMDARLKKARRECDSFRKQRDELIEDMAEVKRKAKAFDEIVKTLDKSESPEDFGDLVWGILMDYGVIHNEG
ncbi:MAG: hypothetical protein E7K10_01095 [Staphylococcus sp.]|nr:hypothetical protein [Staphylococcus sp.]